MPSQGRTAATRAAKVLLTSPRTRDPMATGHSGACAIQRNVFWEADMAKFLSFFPRNVYMGDSEGSGTVYSDVFDVADGQIVRWEGRIWSKSLLSLTGV